MSNNDKECREAFEKCSGNKVTLKNLQVYEGWRMCYIYMKEQRKKRHDSYVDDLFETLNKTEGRSK